jgi:5-methylcytosine-specific restriction endonuclease McrA
MPKYSMPPDSPSLFDGKVCTKCGVWKLSSEFTRNNRTPDGRGPQCKTCHMDYYRSDREALNERRRAYYREHKEEAAARTRLDYIAKREERLAYAKAYREAHADRIRLFLRQYKETHKDRLKEQHRAYWKANADRSKIHKQRRKARKLGQGGTFTLQEWQALCLTFENRCLACGATGKLTPDHVIPLARGGRNDIENIQPLCLTCNLQKGTKTTDYRDPEQLAAFIASLRSNQHAT